MKTWAKNMGISIKDGYLYFGEHKTNWVMEENATSIPKWWCIRANRDSDKEMHPNRVFWGFITGFDITEKGYWMGGTILLKPELKQHIEYIPDAVYSDMQTVEYILRTFHREIKKDTEWRILVEEPQYRDYDDLEGYREMIEII